MTEIEEIVKKLEEVLTVMRGHGITPSRKKMVEEIETVLDVLRDVSSSSSDKEDARTRAELLIRSRPV